MNDFISSAAARRSAIHATHASSRPLSDGYDEIGLLGEVAFGQFCGMCPDFSTRPDGDKGVDFVVPLLYTVDVKTARKANNLIHEAGKPMPADIYVLAEVVGDGAELVGWAWKKSLQEAPTRDFGHGIVNHYIPRDQLRTIRELAWRLHMARFCRPEELFQ